MDVVGSVSVICGVYIYCKYILNALTKLASDKRSGLLFMQSNLKFYLILFPFLSTSSSSSISIPN
jgi:hypothetical protein